VKARKPGTFQRDAPDLPAEFARADSPDQLFADHELVAIAETRLHDLERPNLNTNNLRIEGSLLERVRLSESQFASTQWKDVRLTSCDLANVRVHRLTLVRVEFLDCRLTGFRATAVDCQNVLIRSGDLGYSQFRGGKFRACEFDACNWQEADLQEADLTGSLFRSCSLARADLRGAKLQDTDFRGSEIEGMLVNAADLQGAIVDPAQAMIFARLLGLQIR